MTLDDQAIAILRGNDRGGFTIPTRGLYPYQWNWDSAFVALGFAAFDRPRAWAEVTTVLEGQWPDGMVPSILFRRDDPDYFPGPRRWGANLGPIPSTGVSQPPVLSTAVRLLAGEDDADRLDNIFDKLLAWHNWYHTARTFDGVIATVHPWETGRDNCPDWNIGLDAMEVAPDLAPYERMDNKHVDASFRPSQAQYDRYLTIIQAGQQVGWDQARLTTEGPFLMADPNINFVLLRADRDLFTLAERLGRDQTVRNKIQGWIAKGEAASDRLWNDQLGGYAARDLHSGRFSDGFTNASALCFYAGVGAPEQRARTLQNIRRIGERVQYMLPSWDPDAQDFEPQRYWCGPIWPQMNFMIAMGLREQGEAQLADRMQSDLTRLIEASGFWECFNPVTGAGCVGSDFSWTAAMWLAWLSPSWLTRVA
ncbi:trehalase family glycosidase [Actibacterium sp. 188UL27-1]|uniref:MGH1-like glycoside hydrolase domain-containing protein n=1 Tax=Actibacterium sp. 188UL27-1 TaxID=2786961 RepID=UPI00195606E0|nr:trehalase family glycosidase [Actibacterium sp. 188UL27-1]MBM7069654.1 hypothetical protein [Actibacterium sp. 188UL27-1]